MSGALQAVFQNQRSFIPPLPADIGAAYGGGFFAGQISTAGNGTADYNLVIGPVSSAQSSLAWKNQQTGIIPVSFINGPQNTADLVADGNSTVYPAAHFCNDLVIGGFSDWYMPARNELEVCYYFLKPTTTSNNASGANANAVSPEPINTNYSSGSPARTSATAFQSGGAQAFSANEYWSSTSRGSDNEAKTWRQHFDYGLIYGESKTGVKNVRAVRRVAV
jgi:hypothetical protein